MFLNFRSIFKHANSLSLGWLALAWTLIILVPILPNTAYKLGAYWYAWKVEFLIALLLSFYLVQRLRQKQVRTFTIAGDEQKFLFAPFVLFILWSVFSVLWSQSAQAAIHYGFVWSAYLIFYIFVRGVVDNPKLLRISLFSLGVCAGVIGFICVLEYVLSPQAALSEGEYRMRYARCSEILVALIPLFVALSLRGSKKNRFFYAAVAVTSWSAVLFSLSRGAALAGGGALMILFAAVFLIPQMRRCRQRAALIFAILIAVSVASQTVFSNHEHTTIVGRLNSTSEYQQSSAQTRILLWNVSLEMFKANLLTGVGADNYAVALNNYRARYAARQPHDPNVKVGENLIWERAHNEYLQVLAELGIAGGILFAMIVFGFAFFALRQRQQTVSLIYVAAACGLLAFLASSFFSSYSFRMMQNGAVFFFLLAIVWRGLAFEQRQICPAHSDNRFNNYSMAAVVFGLLVCAGLSALSARAAVSQLCAGFADDQEQFADKEFYYQTALRIDSTNSVAAFGYAALNYDSARPREAVALFSTAIKNGINTSPTYSYLASAQILAGNAAAAEQTLNRAVEIYPRSVFIRIRYSTLLAANGKNELAAEQYNAALKIDRFQAEGWSNALKLGVTAAALAAQHNAEIAAPSELQPQNGLHAIINEHKILNFRN